MHFNEWVKLTSDRWILNTVCGYSVELCKEPLQIIRPSPIKFNELEMLQIEEELQRFSNCKIIEEVHDSDQNEYISNIFTRPQKDGNIFILNLKPFNKQFMEQIHGTNSF